MKELFSQNSKWALVRFFGINFIAYFLLIGSILFNLKFGVDFQKLLGELGFVLFYCVGLFDFKPYIFRENGEIRIPTFVTYIGIARWALIWIFSDPFWSLTVVTLFFLAEGSIGEKKGKKSGWYMKYEVSGSQYNFDKIKSSIQELALVNVDKGESITGYSIRRSLGSVQVCAERVGDKIIVMSFPTRFTVSANVMMTFLFTSEFGKDTLDRILEASKHERTI